MTSVTVVVGAFVVVASCVDVRVVGAMVVPGLVPLVTVTVVDFSVVVVGA